MEKIETFVLLAHLYRSHKGLLTREAESAKYKNYPQALIFAAKAGEVANIIRLVESGYYLTPPPAPRGG